MRVEQWIYTIPLRLRALFHRNRMDSELDEEIRNHLERQIEFNLAGGMNSEAARLAALRRLGNAALLRDQTRATWNWNGLEQLMHDLRIGIRTLTRTPGFALVAVLVMALGIGANVALFTVVRSVLLKPLPFSHPEQLATLYEDNSDRTGGRPWMPVDAGSYWEWESAVKDRAELALVSPFQEYNVSAERGKLPEQLDVGWCEWNFFHVLGVEPALGRSFRAEDDQPGAQATAILSDRFWKRRYAADPGVVGRTIWLDAKPYTVIGVLPESFSYTGSFGSNQQEVWTAVRHDAPPTLLRSFDDHEFVVIGRLLHGTTQSALVGELKALQRQIKAAHAEQAVHDSASGRSMLDDAVEDYKTPLYALLAATGCVLLIACMNVASLLVARAASRRKELAIRAALGGGWARLLRERIVESTLLSMAGGGFGFLLAGAAVEWLMHTREGMHRVEAIHIDGVVVAFTVGVVALCALVAGAISALSVGGANILGSLQESSRAHSAGTARAGLRKSLLVVEVSLTMVLLVGAGLLLRSFQRLRSTDIGVPVDNVLTMFFSLPKERYKTPVQQVTFFDQLITQVRGLPGVEAAGLASQVPGEGWGGDDLVSIIEHPAPPKDAERDLMVYGADPGYFSAIRMPLLRGRIFTSEERLERANVVLISEGARKQLFPNDEDPIGKHLTDDYGKKTYEIIGVVGDTRYYIGAPPMPALFWPIYGNDYSAARIVVRATRNVESLAIPVQKIIGRMDPDLPVAGVMTLREAIGKSTVDSEFDSVLVLAFAVIALVLASAGLYGVLAYLVSQRTTEIGIRIALGAKRVQVLRLMLLDGLRPALLGLVLGLAGSAYVVRQIKSMLYETEPLDPWVFATVSGTLIAVAALACIIPAWRASRVDPVQALRTE